MIPDSNGPPDETTKPLVQLGLWLIIIATILGIVGLALATYGKAAGPVVLIIAVPFFLFGFMLKTTGEEVRVKSKREN